MHPMSNAIELDQVRHKAGSSFEIRDLSPHVPIRSIYRFLGPNGSGKTTTIRLLMGMHRASAGRISVLGHAIPTGDDPRPLLRTKGGGRHKASRDVRPVGSGDPNTGVGGRRRLSCWGRRCVPGIPHSRTDVRRISTTASGPRVDSCGVGEASTGPTSVCRTG